LVPLLFAIIGSYSLFFRFSLLLRIQTIYFKRSPKSLFAENMEITSPSLFVHIVLFFFSTLLVYMVIVYPGQIQLCVLERHPESYKKRKPAVALVAPVLDEEIISSTPVDIELPEENFVEELINIEEDLNEIEIISIHQTNKPPAAPKSPCEISQTNFEMWQENEEVINSIKKEIESTCNFATAEEGVDALKNPYEIRDRLQTGFDLWKQNTGKKGMTYSELREMFG